MRRGLRSIGDEMLRGLLVDGRREVGVWPWRGVMGSSEFMRGSVA